MKKRESSFSRLHTVESIQRLILNRRTPDRLTEVPVSQDLDTTIDALRQKMRDRDRLLAQEKLVGMLQEGLDSNAEVVTPEYWKELRTSIV